MSKPKRLFITGTDTDAGKTVVASALLHALNAAGASTAALKPVAAGVLPTADDSALTDMRNEDAVLLQEGASVQQDYAEVNPFVFEAAIAPHIAADNTDRRIALDDCIQACQPALQRAVDVVVIEGAGGWLVPLNEQHSLADLAVGLRSEVVLVVGLRLGCINHALLTVESIERSGLKLVGWVANHLAPNMTEVQANIETLTNRIDSPLLAEIPWHPDQSCQERAQCFDIHKVWP